MKMAWVIFEKCVYGGGKEVHAEDILYMGMKLSENS